MSEPNVTLDQAQAIAETKTAPKVTAESIKAKIGEVDYLRRGRLTICIITMANGFHVVGKAAPASPENFDPEVGERYAYEDAFKQIWPLEGYALLEHLAS